MGIEFDIEKKFNVGIEIDIENELFDFENKFDIENKHITNLKEMNDPNWLL